MWRDAANGFALVADRNGSNLRNTGKETYIVYGNAFGMFAAAAYYAAFGDASALTLAINAFNYLDTYFYDHPVRRLLHHRNRQAQGNQHQRARARSVDRAVQRHADVQFPARRRWAVG
jgi:mannose/cellobiose epimerase-like protein (N-acyl-D-glucosamine 2-epimerase family)